MMVIKCEGMFYYFHSELVRQCYCLCFAKHTRDKISTKVYATKMSKNDCLIEDNQYGLIPSR